MSCQQKATFSKIVGSALQELNQSAQEWNIEIDNVAGSVCILTTVGDAN